MALPFVDPFSLGHPTRGLSSPEGLKGRNVFPGARINEMRELRARRLEAFKKLQRQLQEDFNLRGGGTNSTPDAMEFEGFGPMP